MKQVVVFPRGQLSKQDKERLTKAGVVAVEADDPSKVTSILPSGSMVSGDDMLMSAMKAVVGSGYSEVRSAFVKEIFRRMEERERENSSAPQQ